MPSPIGHALAGVAVVYAADAIDGRRSSTTALAICAGLAMLPDIDLFAPDAHRTATHSLTAACITFIVADNFPPRGIQLLWPWSDRWFISDLDVFRQTARQHVLTWPIVQQNAHAVAQEVAILLPVVAVLWLIRVKAAPRLAPEVSRRDHPAE